MLPSHAAELAARGPAECPDAEELSYRVQRHIGVELNAAAPLRFDVTFERAGAGYSAQIDVSAPAGAAPQRCTLSAPDCTKLGDAVSVAAALALGVAAPEQSADGAAEIATAPPATPAPPAPAPPAPGADDAGAEEPSPEANAPWVPRVSLWVIGDAGSLPSPGLGAALGAELASGRFALRALGTILFEQQTELASVRATAPGAKLELLTAGVLGCTLPFNSPSHQPGRARRLARLRGDQRLAHRERVRRHGSGAARAAARRRRLAHHRRSSGAGEFR